MKHVSFLMSSVKARATRVEARQESAFCAPFANKREQAQQQRHEYETSAACAQK
jgi:hypothetical protein